MQLEELGDEVIRRTNSACTRLMKIKTNTGISLTKPEPITSENIKDKIISDDELKQRIINGELVDEKLEATLFPNGKPNK